MDDIKDKIAREILAATGFVPKPEWAQTFKELRAKTDMSEDRLRKYLSQMRDAGKWKSGWYGGTFYYWPVEPPEEAE